jgi:hypothetical protein
VLINADFSALTLSRGRAALTATSLRTRTGRHTSNTLSLILIQWFRVLATSPLQSAQTSYAHSHTSSSQNMMLAARFTHTHTHTLWFNVDLCESLPAHSDSQLTLAFRAHLTTEHCASAPPHTMLSDATSTTCNNNNNNQHSACDSDAKQVRRKTVCVCVCVVPANNLHAVGFVQHSPKGNNNALGLSLYLSLSL